MLKRFLSNSILANLAFLLVLGVGAYSYLELPRQQDPTINFNWVAIVTGLPGASADDVEKRVTDILEDGIEQVSDIKFISSTSRPGISNILVRFEDIDDDTFDKRVADLRREIQNKNDELPDNVSITGLVEITSANALAAATVLVVAEENDENQRKQGLAVVKDLERFAAVDRVDNFGDRDPELQVLFDPEHLVSLGVSPSAIANTVTAYFRDLAAGSIELGEQKWLVHISGTDNNPEYLGNLPVVSASGEIPLRSIAQVERGREDPAQLIRYQGKPALMLDVYKKPNANVLDLLEEVNAYIENYNRVGGRTGIKLVLLDDQTSTTRNALRVMRSNALIGLGMVMLVTWLFLGLRIAFLTSIGIPFVLAGTFWVLAGLGQTLNVVVLLGIVISLGMLVDDAVVVVEAIYYRMQRGMNATNASVEALREVFAPVTTSVMTTMAAFLPLMLLPGILGKFMSVTPLVVTTALAISLVEAYWMLPSHIISANIDLNKPSRVQQARVRATRSLRHRYSKMVLGALRRPKRSLFLISIALIAAITALSTGQIRFDFFASDNAPLFRVSVEMPTGTRLEKTLQTTLLVEQAVQKGLREGEARNVAAYAGLRYTDREPLVGDQHGQVTVSLLPDSPGSRSVEDIIESMRDSVTRIPGPLNVSFLRLVNGPPTSKPVSLKVRGDDPELLREATDRVIEILQGLEPISDINDDDIEGRMELSVRLNPDAILRAGLNPATVMRDVRLFADGEVVASMQDKGERLNVRVKAQAASFGEIDGFLRNNIGLTDGGAISLGQLLNHEVKRGRGSIRHYNLRRTITVEAELDKELMDTLTVNRQISQRWATDYASRYPTIDLDFTGELDDIQESLNAMPWLFAFGIGVIYLILGTQFRSYVQPLIVLSTIPMAFTGVVLGLFISGNPMSLYTLYGVIALAGIAVNSAIVLISAANERLEAGMALQHAIVYAARRRVVPIIITSLTTVAGLLSLALGLGGDSLMWGPVASAIVWGLGISTILTLFVIPLLYSLIVHPKAVFDEIPLPPKLPRTSPMGLANVRARLSARLNLGGRAELLSLEEIWQNEALEENYRTGRIYLEDGEPDLAIKAFERAAKLAPKNGLLQRCAAQACVIWQQKNGWDIGYHNRAVKYLAQTRKLSPDDELLALLERNVQESFDSADTKAVAAARKHYPKLE